MSAIISNNFRLENANNFIASVANVDNSVYVFVGKSDRWGTTLADITDTASTPANTLVEMNDAWRNAIGLKKINASDAINVVNRHDWSNGTVYVAWDDADADIFTKEFYIITTEFKVYKCIKSPGTGSTVMPTQTNVNPTAESDGYTWKYMFTVSVIDSAKFLVSSYIPVKTVTIPEGGDINDLSADDQTKYTFQQNSEANAGKIYRVVVTNGGSGYSSGSPPAVTISGDGSGATATAVVDGGGTVTAINITNSGSNYNVTYVTVAAPVSGTRATARAVLSPKNGHGTDPVSELGAYYVGVATSLSGTEGGDFIVNNSFRQIGLIKNPYNYGTSTVSTAVTLNALKILNLASGSNLTPGDYIIGGTSGAKGYIDDFDSGLGVVKYHQNDKTGYTAFQNGESLTTGSGTGSGTIAGSGGLSNPEVETFTGDILFLENRAAINRSASQIEDVKIIIEF